ncbi:GNAT family N-acetyltransferase [Amycolatopsis sp. NPDC059027]|uniref:GNAT family N-acetyltransferase n=1 Tax=Amycolatopsis sp. NPDC059027 TaxID=3346709 RepID=UPI00366C4B79
MSDFDVRPLRPEEHRAASDLFRATLHRPPATDAEWAAMGEALVSTHGLGAFDPALIGMCRSFDDEATVPGGAWVPMAAVATVGVRADRTRRGVLSAMMAEQLGDFARRDVPVAMLHASEATIYGRFGYGVSTRGRDYVIDRHRARLRSDIPVSGEISLLDLETSLTSWERLYRGLDHPRPGMLARSATSWAISGNFHRKFTAPVTTAVHHGPDGVDGFAVYTVSRTGRDEAATMDLTMLYSATPQAFAGLWRYLLSVDLVDRIRTEARPLDEPIDLLLTDPRQVTTTCLADESWLRLVDVPAALAAREYRGDDPVVLEVTDPLLPTNSGRYRISADGAARTADPAALRLDVGTLAMAYLGTWRPSTLASAGRIEARDPAALEAADALFSTRATAWCGTFF